MVDAQTDPPRRSARRSTTRQSGSPISASAAPAIFRPAIRAGSARGLRCGDGRVLDCDGAGLSRRLRDVAPARDLRARQEILARPDAGARFTQVDCSGFVREIMRRATNLGSSFPDGSVIQHQWVDKKGFARATVADGKARDGAVRIAFLSPNATASGIGHVALIVDGATLESHGGVGPDSRPWSGAGWQASTALYLLAPGG